MTLPTEAEARPRPAAWQRGIPWIITVKEPLTIGGGGAGGGGGG